MAAPARPPRLSKAERRTARKISRAGGRVGKGVCASVEKHFAPVKRGKKQRVVKNLTCVDGVAPEAEERKGASAAASNTKRPLAAKRRKKHPAVMDLARMDCVEVNNSEQKTVCGLEAVTIMKNAPTQTKHGKKRLLPATSDNFGNKRGRSHPEAIKHEGMGQSGFSTSSQCLQFSSQALRAEHRIVVEGPGLDVVPMQTFEALRAELSAPLLKALKVQGYIQPTAIQAQTCPLVFQGRDVIGVAATGSGKTCAFILPVLARIAARGVQSPSRGPVRTNQSGKQASDTPPTGSWKCPKCSNVNFPQRVTCNTRTCKAPRPETSTSAAVPGGHDCIPAKPSALVLAPTRELAQQIHMETCKFTQAATARAVCIYGGVPKGEQAGTLRGAGADIVIATPGRCLDFLNSNAFLGTPLSAEKVTYLVLDEADRMMDIGFLPEIQKIVALCPPGTSQRGPQSGGAAGGPKANTCRQTLFFTATWPHTVQQLAWSVVAATATVVRVAQQNAREVTANESVVQRVEVMGYHSEKLERLKEVLQQDMTMGTCIVFCKTKKRCDWLVGKLQGQCSWIHAMHSGKEQREREQTLQSFRTMTINSGKQKGVLVATNVAARGLDIPGVSLVVVYDFSAVDDYVHQIGRTGRAGLTGHSVAFYVDGDGDAQKLVNVLEQAGQEVPVALVDLAAKKAIQVS